MTDKLRDAAQQNEREAFEAWARPVGFYLTRNEILGHYTNIDTTRAWEGWQARAALAQQDAQAVPQGWREFLKEIEWANSDYNAAGDAEPYCVCCDAWQSQGHKPDCKFMAMLNSAPTPPAQQDAQAVDFDDAYASTTMALVEDYAKAVHDGDDAACSVLRQTIKASLEQAAPTPPAQHGCFSTGHVGLTDEEIERIYTEETGSFIDDSPWALTDFARAIIEAYETKNGINRG